MGNEQSAPGRREPAPRLAKVDYDHLEGGLFVIFPHLVSSAAPPAEDVSADDNEDEPEQHKASDNAAEEGNEQRAAETKPVVHFSDTPARTEVTRTPTRPLPSWARMAEVLQRNIPDLPALLQALTDMGSGAPPLVAAFKGIFAHEPAFEPRFFEVILPTIQRLALRLPEVFPAEQRLPLLVPGQDGEVTLTQEQCAVLVASSFMGTLWIHPAVHSRFKWPSFRIQDLFTNRQGPSVAILRMILHYFERLSIQMPEGKVTFRRQVLKKAPDWANSTKPLVPARVSDKGKIEDAETPFHADFANQYIGGGVLHGGCVQEEILFAIKPECLVSLLFCAKMNVNEVIFITGAERFSDYQGYAQGLRFGGDYVDRTPRDDQGRIVTTIVAVDAVVAFGGIQWTEEAMLRDLNKVYCACWEPARKPDQTLDAFATGNWGCGAFGGDKSLKMLQQMMAAAEADREVLYHTFGERYGSRPLKEWIQLLNDLIRQHHPTVGEVYRLMRKRAPSREEQRNVNMFEQLLHHYALMQEKKEEKEEAEAKHEGEEEEVVERKKDVEVHEKRE